jgi:hypothetical protein
MTDYFRVVRDSGAIPRIAPVSLKKIASTCRQLMLGRKEGSNAAVTDVLSGRREIPAAQLEPVATLFSS